MTVVETREERMTLGRPVGRAVPYAAMGGLTGFSSLAEGYLRLDPSGIASCVEIAITSVSRQKKKHKLFEEYQYSASLHTV